MSDIVAFLSKRFPALRRRPHEGYARLRHGETWYQIVGRGKGVPLIVIHGGPGFTHEYLEPLLALANERPVILYDQIGCGKSDTTDPSLWKITTFVKELEDLVAYLGLKEYALLGHSCGAMIALDFTLGKPEGLKALILASPIVATADWIRDVERFIPELPEKVRATIKTAKATNAFDSREFEQATNYFNNRHVCSLMPPPACYARAARAANRDLYRTIWGPTEFIINGNCEGYDRRDRLHEISVPTLFTCGDYEAAKPETMQEYAAKMRHAACAIFHRSSHMPHLEETDKYLSVIRDFLKVHT